MACFMKAHIYQMDYLVKVLFIGLFIMCSTILCGNFVSSSGTDQSLLYNISSVSDEFTIPQRLTQLGSSWSRQWSNSTDKELIYSIDILQNTYEVHLLPNAQFISPDISVVDIENDGRLSSSSSESVHGLRSCFYVGSVAGDHASRVACSVCGGLHGIIVFGDGRQFEIEPVEQDLDDDFFDRIHRVRWINPTIRNQSQSERIADNDYPIIPIAKHSYKLEYTNNGDLEVIESSPRSRRSFSWSRHVETMVVADASMFEYYGGSQLKLRKYLLSVMAIVTGIFKDPSIGNDIAISVVKIVILKKDPRELSVSQSAAKTLKSFCRWQRKLNHADDKHPEHYDTAVLITRKDLCTSKSKCDTLGFAEIGTICDTQRSCSVSEDNGLSVAFTIAHELGHLFNSQHDGKGNDCTEARSNVHIMTPSFSLNSKTWTWSYCSRKSITEFLESGHGHCLFDKPSLESKHHLPIKLPGEMFTADEQCALVFGKNASTCPYTKSCERLWCMKRHGNKQACHTNNMPWADGTDCGKSMWCIRGQCQQIANLKAVHGKWGEWQPFGQCSRSCGGGIAFSERECNNPTPLNGGDYCIGKRRRHRSCNTQECPAGTVSFRHQQCAAFNDKKLNIQGVASDVLWVPKTKGVAARLSCRLMCEVEGQNIYYELAPRAIDGTECAPGSSDKCVEGKCRPAGCDRVLNSKAKMDRCGVCNGDNSSCRKESGSLNVTRYGYNFVVRIPAGASGLIVTQYSSRRPRADTNFLAVVNDENRYLFNGHFVVSLGSRKFTDNGVDIHYSGSDVRNETIRIPGKLKSPVTIEVLSVGSLIPCNIQYSYNVPVVGRQNYTWVLDSNWTKCNRLCNGHQKRHYRCQRISDGLFVADAKCNGNKPHFIEEKCNRECQTSWLVTGESDCSVVCGSGYKTRTVQCLQKHTNISRSPEVVDNKHCVGLVKPKKLIDCHSTCSGHKWIYTSWSKCSKECDGGNQVRVAFCVDSLSRKLALKDCNLKTRATLTRSCNNIGCPSWKTSEWGLCSVQCGRGEQHRDVYCVNGIGKPTKMSICHAIKRPDVTQPCEMRTCPSWQTGAWTRCSVTCGLGTQGRKVRCRRTDGELVADEECEPTLRPSDRKECRARPCPVAAQVLPIPLQDNGMIAVWMTGAWTECSKTCGIGIQERYVSCRYANGDVAQEKLCIVDKKPSSMKQCQMISCPRWVHTAWSDCTAVCDGGFQTRLVRCESDSDRDVAYDHQCDNQLKPREKRQCNAHVCAAIEDEDGSDDYKQKNTSQWRFGPWSACSVSCGMGTRERHVTCDSESDGTCDGDKPTIMQICHSGPCPGWNYGNWTTCSKSCGEGEQSRDVVCQYTNGTITADQYCNATFRPSNTHTCKLIDCPTIPRWSQGPWQPCSVSCGNGFRFREVFCENIDGSKLADVLCHDIERKPKQQETCRLSRCIGWKEGAWSECDRNCLRHRNITCVDDTDDTLNLNECNLESKPFESETCDKGNCLLDAFTWRVGNWTPCDRTCGYSVRRRALWCVNARDERVSVSYCNDTQPKVVEACTMGQCLATWITGEWGQCSKSCDSGIQRRRVTCDKPPTSARKSCPFGERPRSWRVCNLGKCGDDFHWRTGHWSQCSARCGGGFSKRAVICVDKKGRKQKESSCKNDKPGSARVCNTDKCPPSSCRDIKSETGLNFDGEHILTLESGKQIQIYCEGMERRDPLEYVTLKADPTENYSIIYGKRLGYRGQCPGNNTGITTCHDCLDYSASGSTYFSKVRIDLRKLVILTDDTKFAVKFGRNPPPFASAGDCFSRKKCPQGKFQINFKGTGLYVEEQVAWSTRGYHTAQKINRLSNGQVVFGECGGYCGMCSPSRKTGLKVSPK